MSAFPSPFGEPSSGFTPMGVSDILPPGEKYNFDEEENELENNQEEEFNEPIPFYGNLAKNIEKSKLNKLSETLIEAINSDKESRKGWEDAINLALDYTGFDVQSSKKKPFANACGAFDSTLATALITSYSHARAELFPAEGPARIKINGMTNEVLADQGDRISSFINYYLTEEDRPYYPDSEKLLMNAIFMGSAFRKVWHDPIIKKPLSRSISSQDFIIDVHTPSILTSTRMTQVVYYSRREVILMERSGDFIKFDTPEIIDDEDEPSMIQTTIDRMDGISKESSENKVLFKFYETYVELSVDQVEGDEEGSNGNDIPRPYIITICESTKKVVAIRRNWKEGDTEYKRKDYFVHYYYMPGFGIYGLGLAHLIGSNAIVLTDILRQTIDAGTLKNFPGGLRMAGLKPERNDLAVGPASFVEIDTGGIPLAQAVMLMPYGEPSVVLIELRNKLIEEVSLLCATTNMDLPEHGTNAPVGTTLAMLEVQNKVMSTVLRSFHTSLGYELSLIFDLFGEYLPENEPYPFMVQGKSQVVMKQDFSNQLNVTPVSDPNILTTAHRLILCEATMRLAQSQPNLYNMVEVHRRMLQAMKVDSIDTLLITPPQVMPLDPITENMNAMQGRPLKAAEWQDHDAHNMVHMQLQGDPNMAAHMQEHNALKYYTMMKMQFQQMGMQLPPIEQMQDPEIQNQVAMYAAQISQQMQQAQQAQQPDPNAMAYQAAMADVNQRAEAARLKDEETKLKTEVDIEKANLKHESEMARIDAQLEIAREKNAVDMSIAGLKQTQRGYPNV